MRSPLNNMRLVKMLKKLIARTEEEGLRLAPFIGGVVVLLKTFASIPPLPISAPVSGAHSICRILSVDALPFGP